MANWQVISLDTTTPQLRAPGTGDGYSFNSGSTQLGVWTTAGLGVDTASPTSGYKLDVNGSIQATSTASNYIAARFLAASGAPSNIALTRAGYAAWYIGSRNNDTAFNITVTDQTHATPFLTITATGNVGIGTANPTGKLTVSNAGAGGVEFFPTGGVGGGPYYGAYNRSTLAYIPFTTYTSTHTWYVSTAGNVRAMDLDASGNLGLGTTSPTARVHAYSATAMKQLTVDGVGAIKTGVNFASGGTTYGQIYFDNNSPYDMSVVQQYTTGSLIFGTNSTERARISSTGNVVVNTAAVATTATDGFLYIPTCAGAPTGVPTTFTGRSPLVVDSTNNRFYVYVNGAWKYATLT